MSKRRPFGSTRKRQSGRHEARYVADGQSYRAPDTFATEEEATLYLDTMRVKRSEGTWLDPSKSGQTLASYANAWITQRSGPRGRPLAVRTIEGYRDDLALYIAPTIGLLPLAKVTPAVVREWHSDLMATGKLTATRKAYAFLHAVMNTAVVDGAVLRNPCQIKGAGQPHSPERPLLTLRDVTALASAMPQHLRCLVYVTFWGALRLGEVVALRRGDVDLATGVLRIDRQEVETDDGPTETLPKTGRTRTVVLPAPVIQALAEHLGIATGSSLPTARLFTRPDGGPLRGNYIHKAWGPARKAAGLPGVHVHDLRHARLTLAAQRGATTKELMELGGHASPAAALIYQHAAPDRMAALAAAMADDAERMSEGMAEAKGSQMARSRVVDLDAARKSAEG